MTDSQHSISREFFDRTLEIYWDMIPIYRTFDNNKVKEYMSLLEETDRSFIGELINNTIYIPYIKFI